MSNQHWAIFINNESNTVKFIRDVLDGTIPALAFAKDRKGMLFSKLTLQKLKDEEDRYGAKTIAKDTQQPLRTMSSGEQKKALLEHLFVENPDFIVLDNPFDNLDTASQAKLAKDLQQKSTHTIFVQIISRKGDLLPFISNFARLDGDELVVLLDSLNHVFTAENGSFQRRIPSALHPIEVNHDPLVHLRDVTVRYGEKIVVKNIHWEINKGEFWQLFGKNGSGKTTLLSMITGENPKGYGQELFLFGKKKGSGESIWDIKKKIGYFTPAMTDKFTGYHTIEHMLISGFKDSIGLYTQPTEAQLRLAKEWLLLLDMWKTKDTLFHDLSVGQKRLVMTTRAMIKHPPLLILDEPTVGLDDTSANLLVALVNKMAKESNTTIVFVSHRKEPGLRPQLIYHLETTKSGSTGKVLSKT